MQHDEVRRDERVAWIPIADRSLQRPIDLVRILPLPEPP